MVFINEKLWLGEIKVKLSLDADFASKSAIDKIKKIGGKLTLKNSK